MLVSVTLCNKWVTKQIDFSNAFVRAPLEKTVYVALSPMFINTGNVDRNDLCLKLNKCLYGMKDAPKIWHDHLESSLLNASLKPFFDDPGVYLGRGMAIVVYVDDMLIFGPD